MEDIQVTVGWTYKDELEVVEVAPGYGLLPRFTAKAWGSSLPAKLEVDAQLSDGRYGVVGVRSDRPLNTARLREIPVTRLLRSAMPSVLRKLAKTTGGASSEPAAIPRLLGGPTDDALQAVAGTYLLAVAFGEPATEAVADKFNLPRSTAGRWVGQAREAGYLGPAVGTKAGEKRRRRR